MECSNKQTQDFSYIIKNIPVRDPKNIRDRDKNMISDEQIEKMRCDICYQAIVEGRKCSSQNCQFKLCKLCMIHMKSFQFQCPNSQVYLVENDIQCNKFQDQDFNKFSFHVDRVCLNDNFESMSQNSDIKDLHDTCFIKCQNENCEELMPLQQIINCFNKDIYDLHFYNCKYRITSCKFCSRTNPFYYVQIHENSCDKRTSNCEICEETYLVVEEQKFKRFHDCQEFILKRLQKLQEKTFEQELYLGMISQNYGQNENEEQMIYEAAIKEYKWRNLKTDQEMGQNQISDLHPLDKANMVQYTSIEDEINWRIKCKFI